MVSANQVLNPQYPATSSDFDARTGTTASVSYPNSNPLYVHSANHADISLVSEKLTGLEKLNTWLRLMYGLRCSEQIYVFQWFLS